MADGNMRAIRPDDSIAVARKVAHILGPSSGAAKAIADYERRQKEGGDPVLIIGNGVYFVVDLASLERHDA